jgi:hypothetical protein
MTVKAGASDFYALDCIGKAKSAGYPFGEREEGKALIQVHFRGSRLSVLIGSADMCPEGATCKYDVTKGAAELDVSDVPGQPMYNQSFRLDRKSNAFSASGGGVDGGWSVIGTCKPLDRYLR